MAVATAPMGSDRAYPPVVTRLPLSMHVMGSAVPSAHDLVTLAVAVITDVRQAGR